MSSDETRVIRNDQIPTGEIDGEIVALDLEQGNCFGMDRVGAAIWEMTAESLSVSEIADRLVETHEVERGRCLAEIRPFIDELLEAGLLRRAD